MKYTLIVDEREKLPYSYFGNNVIIKTATLKTGDYTIEGHEDLFTLERKSLDDYVNSLLKERFYKELKRLESFKFKAIIVEGSLEEIRLRDYSCNIHAQSVFEKTSEILVDYKIPVIFCGDRQHSLMLVTYLAEAYLKGSKNTNVTKTRRKRAGSQSPEDIL